MDEITKMETEGWVPIDLETNKIIAIDSYYGDMYRMVDINAFTVVDSIYCPVSYDDPQSEKDAKASFHNLMLSICGQENYIPEYKMQKFKITVETL